MEYNGSAKIDYIPKGYIFSPTFLNKITMIADYLNSNEIKDCMSMGVQNSFIQTNMPAKEDGERVMMKIWRKLVDCLVEIEPTAYKYLVDIKQGVKLIYLNIIQAIYGMLNAYLLWYLKTQE